MLATILATALAASGTPDWPQRINLEPGHGLLANTESSGAPATATPSRESLRTPRIIAELLGGGVGAVALGAIGGFAGFLASDSSSTVTRYVTVGAAIGANVGALIGVLVPGLVLKGGGSILWTLAGDLIGFGLAMALYAVPVPVLGPIGLVVLPVLGATIAFELSGPPRAPAAVRCLAPVVARF